MKAAQGVVEWLRAIDGYQGRPVVRAALQLEPLVLVRPGELRTAEWADFDLDLAEWHIPAERMKTRQAHLVPLSTQAVTQLRALQSLTGDGRHVFPGTHDQTQPMSDTVVRATWRHLGLAADTLSRYDFRDMARSILSDVLQAPQDLIELQLARADTDSAGRRYSHVTQLAERRVMMQRWADFLDGLRAGGYQIPAPRKQGAA
jgi:integrase